MAGDIHFYGLLKTIGTTPRQIKRIIQYQALVLCIVGIPVEILLGYGLSVGLMPIVLRGSTINRESMTISSSPIIFIGSALFALLTVLISCARPGRLASRVSPVEAVKYTNVNHIKKRERAVRDAKVYQMAFTNLGRSKRKTVLVIVSSLSSFRYIHFESTIREIKANTDAALEGCGYIRTNRAAYMGMEEEVIRRRYKGHLEDAYVDIEIDSMEKRICGAAVHWHDEPAAAADADLRRYVLCAWRNRGGACPCTGNRSADRTFHEQNFLFLSISVLHHASAGCGSKLCTAGLPDSGSVVWTEQQAKHSGAAERLFLSRSVDDLYKKNSL